jgi:DNA-directed RNA polymerase specialized sigma24 family protein
MRSEMNYVKRYHPWGNEHTQRQDPKGGGIPEFEAGHDFTILQKQLYAALPHLTALQRAVIYGRYFKDLPMGKISDKLFIKREEADEAHTRALEILRRKIKR